MRYRLLLADADNTLFDFYKGEAIAIAETFRAFGIPDSPEMVAVYSRANDAQWKKLERGETTSERMRIDRFRDFLAESGFSADPRALCEDYAERLGRQRWMLPGALELCRQVSAHMPVYLVTNGIARTQRSRLAGCPLAPYLSGVIISEEVGYAKPNPQMLFEALRQAGRAPEEAVLLGDSVTADIAAARNAGIDSILFTRGQEPPARHGATWAVHTLEEACDLILQ